MGKYALILVSALIFSVITYSYGLRNALFLSNTRTVQSYSQNQAHNIAQSAAMVAVHDVRNKDNTTFTGIVDNLVLDASPVCYVNNGRESWSEMEGEYNLCFQKRIRTGQEMLEIESTGWFEETAYVVNLGLWFGSSTWDPNFDQALHAENTIEMGGDDYIGCEGLNPCQVTLNSNLADAIKLGSQSKIKIDGDLFLGPGSDIDEVVTGNQNNVSGDIHVMPQKLNYDMPIFPDFSQLNFMTGSSVYSSSMTLSPDAYDQKHIPEIMMTSGTNTLIFDTGGQDREVRIGKMHLSGQNEIKVIGDGKLTVYIDYEVDMKGGSSVNKEGDINHLMLYYKGNQEVELYDETLDFGGNTEFNGSFFAEKANVRLRGTSGIQGNVITGGNVQLSGDAEAISRVIYAPHGTVSANGNVRIRGSVISHNYKGSGNTSLIFDPEFDAELPDLEVDGAGFPIAYWN